MTTTTTPDTELLAMIERLDRLWAEFDRLVDIVEGEPRFAAICGECAQLERVILATPAFTHAGANGKQRIVARADLTDFDDLGLIGTIFELDAERVAAAAG